MRIRVDRDLCQGHGVCESEAPTVFSVPKTGQVDVLDEHPPEDVRRQVEAAVKFYPTHALSLEEE